MRSTVSLIIFLLIAFGVSFVGAQFTPGEWYAALTKPGWNPPSWVFAPVWTLLYAMIGVSGWLVWREREHHDVRPALTVYGIQLVLNAGWSWIFFGLHRMGTAFAELILLWLAVLATLLLFWRIRPLAGLLLVPYLLWLSFAGALNWQLWRLNG